MPEYGYGLVGDIRKLYPAHNYISGRMCGFDSVPFDDGTAAKASLSTDVSNAARAT
jgi:hypothetical protein